MSRILSLAVLASFVSFVIGLPATARAQAVPGRPTQGVPRQDVAWNDAAHIRYFRYQEHLTRTGLTGETREGWGRQAAAERVRKAREGEEFLRARLAEILTKEYVSPEETAMVKAVWGEAAAAGAARVATARKLKDPAQVELALRSVRSAVGQGGAQVDWNFLFDGAKAGADAPAAPERTDYLAPRREVPFLDALGSAEVRRPLASRAAFAEFLRQRGVPPQLLPSMIAMYDVVSRAPSPEKEELSHILPTVVKFLLDGKPVVIEEMAGACGFAVPGEYDAPQKVAVTPGCAGGDPLVIADILTHEFQHIYDMYTGRYYTLDTEMRGFKSNVMFYRALNRQAPGKVAELASSNVDFTRSYAQRWARLDRDLRSGPRDYADQIAFGQGYNHYHEGVFSGRLPLREAVDPNLGAERELAAKIKLREHALAEMRRLENEQASVRARSAARGGSRELDRDLERTSRELEAARAYYAHYDKDVTIRTIRLNRMRSEAAWLDKRSEGQRDPEPYDLHLQVDRDYVTP